jgi:hypothetical protein
MKIKLEIRIKGNRKTNFIFRNFEDQNEWKHRGKKREIFSTKIMKEKKILLAFRKRKKLKNREKKSKNIFILK